MSLTQLDLWTRVLIHTSVIQGEPSEDFLRRDWPVGCILCIPSGQDPFGRTHTHL